VTLRSVFIALGAFAIGGALIAWGCPSSSSSLRRPPLATRNRRGSEPRRCQPNLGAEACLLCRQQNRSVFPSGFSKSCSIRVHTRRSATGCRSKSPALAGLLGKPSDGLEPSTPSLPCDPNGNRWQPVATVSSQIKPFSPGRRAERLPPAAPPLFHNCSIPIGPKTGSLTPEQRRWRGPQ